MVDAGWLVAKVTCVVLEPDGFEVDGRGQVKDVRIASLQQVRDDHLRPETHTREGGGGSVMSVYVHLCVRACAGVCVSYVRYVPLRLIPSIKSTFFMGVSKVPVRLMALALFTRMSIPANHKRAL